MFLSLPLSVLFLMMVGADVGGGTNTNNHTTWTGPTVRTVWRGHSPHTYARLVVTNAFGPPTPRVLLPQWSFPSIASQAFEQEVLGAKQAGMSIYTIDVILNASTGDGGFNHSSTSGGNPGGPSPNNVAAKILQLNPEGLLVLRVESMWLLSAAADQMLLKTANGSTAPAVAFAVNAWTDHWISTAEVALAALLRTADAAHPGKVLGVWLASGASGEWNYPVDSDYTAFADYNNVTVEGYCREQQGKSPVDKSSLPPSPPSPAVNPPSCLVPNVTQRDTPTVGNLFLSTDTTGGAAAVSFNAYLNGRVTVAIQRLAATVKNVSNGAAWVAAFSGYLYNSANVMPFCGHLGMGELLDMPELDAIGTPWLYFNASHDPQWGATLPQGPWDSAALHGKLWVVEDDQRTLFGASGRDLRFGYCHTMNDTLHKLRQNAVLAGMHGVARYMFVRTSF